MSPISLADLPAASNEFTLMASSFESLGKPLLHDDIACCIEDLRRVQVLRRCGINFAPEYYTSGFSREFILANKLFESVTGGKRSTLASSRTTRCVMETLIASLWPVFADEQSGPVGKVILRPKRFSIPPDELSVIDANVVMEELRGHLDNVCALEDLSSKHDGCLVAGLSAQFDFERDVFAIIVNIVASGWRLQALDSLWHEAPYDVSRSEGPLTIAAMDSSRLKYRYDTRLNLPHSLTGLLATAPFTPINPEGPPGINEGIRDHEMTDKNFSEWLLWMDRWNPDDLILFNGLKLTEAGLCLG